MHIKQHHSVDYLFFFIIISLYFIPKYLEYTTFYNIPLIAATSSVLKSVSYALALCWFCTKTLAAKKVSYRFMLLVIPVLVYYTYQAAIADHNTIFVVLLFSLIFEEKYLKNFVSYALTMSCLLYCITILACQAGFIENVITSREKFGSIWTAGGNGFGYSGQMIMMLIPIVFLYYYKQAGKIKWYNNIFWVIISGIVYYKCKTIMGFVLILLFIILYNISSQYSKLSKKVFQSKFITLSPIIFAVASILLIGLYNTGSRLGHYLDIVVNGRLSVAGRVIQFYGIKFLGTDFENNTLNGNYEILDSEYIHMLAAEGILYLIVSLFLCVCIIRYTQKKEQTLVLIWLMIFMNATFNNGIFGLVMNPFGILLVPALKSCFKKTTRKHGYFLTKEFKGNNI